MKPEVHPYKLALRWRQELMADHYLSKAGIAAREQISRARVTQIMNLPQLPAEIQGELNNLTAPLELNAIAERRLREILACSDRQLQLSSWKNMIHQHHSLSQK